MNVNMIESADSIFKIFINPVLQRGIKWKLCTKSVFKHRLCILNVASLKHITRGQCCCLLEKNLSMSRISISLSACAHFILLLLSEGNVQSERAKRSQ